MPNIPQFQAKDVGAATMAGAYGTQPWWWTEQDTYPLAKFFVEDFEKNNNYKPRWGASEIYLQMLVWADAVERAGTFYPIEVSRRSRRETRSTRFTARSGTARVTTRWCDRFQSWWARSPARCRDLKISTKFSSSFRANRCCQR
jgi:ABC-type branched-subunit amino acid transport system substrate-binding protein